MPERYLVKVTRSAEADIEVIWDYVAADNRDAADKFVQELESQIATLEQFPTRCPLIPEAEILQVPYRHLIYSPYRTIFRMVGKVVYVMRIVHGARLLDPITLEMH